MQKLPLRKTLIKPLILLSALCSPAMADAQWTLVDTARVSIAGGLNQHIFVDSSNVPYLSYSDTTGHLMKFDGTRWNFVGGNSITPARANDSWSALAPNGNIYFSYVDGSNSSKAAVMMYNGTSWTSLGNNISTGAAATTGIVVAPNGTPYMSYVDNSTSPSTLYVKDYVSGNWSTSGSAAVTTTGASYPSLAIDASGTVYIAYQDAAASQQITVKKLVSGAWSTVGTSFLAQPFAGAFFIAMAIDNTGVPYVAYMNPFAGGPMIYVSKFDGTAWVNVGAAFGTSGSIFTSITIDKTNAPIVAYQEGAGGKVGVMKFVGTSWVNVGTQGFSSGGNIFTSVTVDRNNNPFVAYMDGGGTSVMKLPVCTAPTTATITASKSLICKGDTVTLQANGTLNDATSWQWFTSSCKGTQVATGQSVKLAPGDTTTYYVHGGGGCILWSPCTPVTINVDSMAKPVISHTGAQLTATGTTGNYQWFKNNATISGANGANHTAASTGWYKVRVTNANGCSAMSDSVFVIPAGIADVSMAQVASAYPSPFASNVQLDFKDGFNWNTARIEIQDLTGRKVFEQKELKQQNIFKLSHLSPGMYFINLINHESKMVMKISKQ